MNSQYFEPGDKAPTDGERPGDAALFAGAETRAGDHAPKDQQAPGDAERLDEAFREQQEPLGGIAGIHFSAPFIRRPVATFLLSIAILLAGVVAYTLLPVASLPQVEFPVISVGASFPGADPETMASAIATPLERQFSRIAGVNQMTSSSSTGSTSITMQFDLDRDVNGAARDVQAAINAARSQLPSNLPQNPSYRKINPSESPIVMLAMTSDTMTVPQMYDEADSILAQKVAQVQGVGQVFVGGSAKPAVRIEANPTQLASYGLGLEALRAAIGSVNVNQPTGYLNGAEPAHVDHHHGPAVWRGGLCSADHRDGQGSGELGGRVERAAGERGFGGGGEFLGECDCSRGRTRGPDGGGRPAATAAAPATPVAAPVGGGLDGHGCGCDDGTALCVSATWLR